MIDNTQLSSYYEKQAEQDKALEKLTTTVDHQKESVDDLDDRMRSLEKQVWGAGAVLAVLFGGIGIVSQMEGVDLFPHNHEHTHKVDKRHLIESKVHNQLHGFQ